MNQHLVEMQHLLKGPGGTLLSVVREFKATLKYRNRSLTDSVYVLRNQPCSLLSRKACVDLGLIFCVEDVSKTPPDFVRECPCLFTCLGKLKTEYHITLEPDVKPVCLYMPRKIPHPLLPKVKTEVHSMLLQGIISPVTVPTNWCSGVIPVPKPKGRV